MNIFFYQLLPHCYFCILITSLGTNCIDIDWIFPSEMTSNKKLKYSDMNVYWFEKHEICWFWTK